jgi:hypothetical protein
MKKFFVPLFIVVLIGLSGLFIARFLFGGDEDTWICSNNQWVKHGNPKAPKPPTGCGGMTDTLQTQTVDEIGITFTYPKDLAFRKEIADDAGKIRVASFYLEKDGYTFYAVYEPNKEATVQDVDRTKQEMDKTTIKDVTVGGVQGIEGLITGPKTRYITVLLKNNRLLTFSTIPPTSENKTITDQILSSFTFK